MTRLRRQRLPGRGGLWSLLLFAARAAVYWPGAAARAETPEQIAVDRNSGSAIHGFDPVSYFADGGPQAGLAEFELRHGGVAWHFRSEANRAAFADNPTLYVPLYGGYDPVEVGRGIASPGHPDFWAIHEKKLLLFNSEDAKRDFERDPAGTALMAEAAWPLVRETLAP